MHFDGTLILLYFIEMLPHTVSVAYVLYAHFDAKEGDEILITITPPKHCKWNSLLMICTPAV